LLFPDDEGGYDVLPFFWAPKEGARRRERTDRVPYETWGREGYLKLTEGNVVDYDVIRADIGDLMKRYNIREIAVDRWNATQLTTQLMGDGIEMVMFGQGFASMTGPTKDLLKLVTAGTLRHGGHPVLRWMAANLATESDAAGNLKPSKKKSTERIDGCVAVIMGLGRAALRGEPGSVYDSRGVDLVGVTEETPVEDDDDF
jgi:phage terminase large subunit-like protein